MDRHCLELPIVSVSRIADPRRKTGWKRCCFFVGRRVNVRNEGRVRGARGVLGRHPNPKSEHNIATDDNNNIDTTMLSTNHIPTATKTTLESYSLFASNTQHGGRGRRTRQLQYGRASQNTVVGHGR
jgi:hypothetical protein